MQRVQVRSNGWIAENTDFLRAFDAVRRLQTVVVAWMATELGHSFRQGVQNVFQVSDTDCARERFAFSALSIKVSTVTNA